MSEEGELEPKYPDMAKKSRPERDVIIIQSLEKIFNELERLSKNINKILEKV